MSAQNPFRNFWGQLKGRGELVQRRRIEVYRVTLSNEEVTTLAELAKSYQGVKAVVTKTDGTTVDFYVRRAIGLAKRSNLRPLRR